jgi:hypothetical protein
VLQIINVGASGCETIGVAGVPNDDDMDGSALLLILLLSLTLTAFIDIVYRPRVLISSLGFGAAPFFGHKKWEKNPPIQNDPGRVCM